MGFCNVTLVTSKLIYMKPTYGVSELLFFRPRDSSLKPIEFQTEFDSGNQLTFRSEKLSISLLKVVKNSIVILDVGLTLNLINLKHILP